MTVALDKSSQKDSQNYVNYLIYSDSVIPYRVYPVIYKNSFRNMMTYLQSDGLLANAAEHVQTV